MGKPRKFKENAKGEVEYFMLTEVSRGHGFGTLDNLMMHFLENRCGDSTMRRIHYCIKCLNRNIFHQVAFWMLLTILGVPLLGEVSYKQGRSS